MKLAVIADDFTGGSDAASFLKRSGANVILVTDIPKDKIECDCLVFALKIRSIDKNKAINKVKSVCDYLKNFHTEHLYYKYCSTFDSTKEGNIGPVLDFLLDYYHLDHCILCPSLPENGRTVKDGILYVNEVRLDESPLKNHPLNPMWDSYIPNLMKFQSKYECIVSNSNLKSCKNKTYIIPNYENNKDAKHIIKEFKNDFLWSGGSGLLEHLFQFKKTIILCGSCSQRTKEQIEFWMNQNKKAYCLNETIHLQEHNELLIYSDGAFKNMEKIKRDTEFFNTSKQVEEKLAELAVHAYKLGFNRIVVAGGETSGAVTSALGFTSFSIGKEIAPGVPTLIPTINSNFHLILKSGNFGNKDFFLKVLED